MHTHIQTNPYSKFVISCCIRINRGKYYIHLYDEAMKFNSLQWDTIRRPAYSTFQNPLTNIILLQNMNTEIESKGLACEQASDFGREKNDQLITILMHINEKEKLDILLLQARDAPPAKHISAIENEKIQSIVLEQQ